MIDGSSKRFVSSPKHTNLRLAPTPTPVQRVLVALPAGVKQLGTNFPTHLHQLSWLRMHGPIPTVLLAPSQLADKFTCTP